MTPNKIARVLAGVAFAVCFCFASTASADTSLTLTNVEGASLGGVYTSPYYATVGGTQNVAVICDDFASESYLGESWEAIGTSLPSLASDTGTTSTNPPKWSSGYSEGLTGSTYTLTAGGLSQATAYTVAAYLGNEILNAVAGSQNQEDLSYAMWTLFDGSTPLSYLSGSDLTNAEADLLSAENTVTLDGLTPNSYSNVTIYSYDPTYGTTCTPGTTCAPPPQEFIAISTPEPSTIILLILGVGGLLFLGRRQQKLESTLAA